MRNPNMFALLRQANEHMSDAEAVLLMAEKLAMFWPEDHSNAPRSQLTVMRARARKLRRRLILTNTVIMTIGSLLWVGLTVAFFYLIA